MSITRKKRSYQEVHERDDAGYIARPTKRRSPMTLLLDVVARIKAEEEEARKQHELDKLIDEWAQLVKADHGALMCTHKANVGFAAKVETILEGTTIDEDAHSSKSSSGSSEWVDNSREEEVRLLYPRSDGVLATRLFCLSEHGHDECCMLHVACCMFSAGRAALRFTQSVCRVFRFANGILR